MFVKDFGTSFSRYKCFKPHLNLINIFIGRGYTDVNVYKVIEI